MSTYDRATEIRQAINAGEHALTSLRNAKASLDSARGWGVIDMFGGGWFSGMIKHSQMDKARSYLEAAKYDLRSFQDELDDVRDLQFMHIDIDGFLTFADFFFDGFWADIMVQSRINNARSQLSEAINRVDNIVRQLRVVM